MNRSKNFKDVTEIAGEQVTVEQLERLCHRYYWVGTYCNNKDVVELACGTGQGLGFLHGISKTFEAADISDAILQITKRHYKDRIRLKQFDVINMPYKDQSIDIIVLLEAIYYISNIESFIDECNRILKLGGKILISTANKDLYDFNPSPHSQNYFGVIELNQLFTKCGFTTKFFGYKNVQQTGLRQKIFRPVKKIAVSLDLIPRTMQGKKILKRVVFGKMVTMPREIKRNMIRYQHPVELDHNKPNTSFKVIYFEATLTN